MLPSRSRFKFLLYACDGARLTAGYALRRPKNREVWITFDDGPHPIHTPKILDTLARHQIRATFFWIGQDAEQHHDIIRRATDDGHLIGNHTYSHPFLTQLDRAAIYDEIMRADEVLLPYYNGQKLFRPPHGDRNAVVDQVSVEAGYQTILWNACTRDWHPAFQPQRWVLLGNFMVCMMEQSIVLMHANLPGTAEYLNRFLQQLQRFNVQFMPPEMLATSWFTVSNTKQ